ncbi:MAG TPA: T9SS type A sorting domain-containing protein, partial [Phnomibacter sp.]|nr:T9SS type A sorting domain-containing protein [Phnomibacter sp.]
NDRLYYSTMFSGDLRYINVGKGTSTYYQVAKIYQSVPLPNNVPVNQNNQGPVVTRMVAGADGYVYGLSNDGNGFFRISTRAKNPEVENLGALIDDAKNEAMSVHASCSSWGGDLVASADGDLYLFSMYQQVFRIDPNSRIATYVGRITGLPGDFSINGAAVQEDGSVMLSSASKAGQLAFMANPEDLQAEIKTVPGWFNTSDLASGYMLNEKKTSVVVGEFDRSSKASGVGVYPNPVTNGEIIVHFKDGMNGRYSLDLFDIGGGSKFQSSVHLNGQAQRVPLRTGTLAQGIYLLRVLSPEDRQVETIKVMIR